MISKNSNSDYFTTRELESDLIRLYGYNDKYFIADDRSKVLEEWILVGLHYQDDGYRCPCGGECNVKAILKCAKRRMRYDCAACTLIEIPHLNPIPIDESYMLLVDNPMGCISYEALMFSVDLKLITMEDFTHYCLIPFSSHYELNEHEAALVLKINTAFITHIKECDSKYKNLLRRGY